MFQKSFSSDLVGHLELNENKTNHNFISLIPYITINYQIIIYHYASIQDYE